MQTDPNFANILYDEATGTLNLIDFGASREYPAEFVSAILPPPFITGHVHCHLTPGLLRHVSPVCAILQSAQEACVPADSNACECVVVLSLTATLVGEAHKMHLMWIHRLQTISRW